MAAHCSKLNWLTGNNPRLQTGLSKEGCFPVSNTGPFWASVSPFAKQIKKTQLFSLCLLMACYHSSKPALITLCYLPGSRLSAFHGRASAIFVSLLPSSWGTFLLLSMCFWWSDSLQCTVNLSHWPHDPSLANNASSSSW